MLRGAPDLRPALPAAGERNRASPTRATRARQQEHRCSPRHRVPQARERRPPASSPGGGRHRGPQGRGGADPNRQDGSLLGTYPSRAGPRATAGPHRENWPLASGRHRPPEAGEGLAFHPHVGRTPGEPRGPAHSYQISPTVKPSGKGSDGSTEYWAIPVIQAVPLIVGTTAGTPPTVVARIRRPTNSVPTGPK